MFQSEMPSFARYGIYLHALLGAVALLAGAFAIAAKKGGWLHRKAGTVFFVAMLSAIVVAIPAIVARRNLFLGLIVPFASQMLLRGWRIARARLGHGRANSWFDWTLTGLSFAAGLFFLGFGLWRLALGWRSVGFAGVFVGFGVLMLALAVRDFRILRSPDPAPLSQHVTSMLGAYTAAVTAFTAVNFHTEVFTPILVWLTPPLAGSLLITWWNFRLAREQRRSERPTGVEPPAMASAE